MGLLKEWMLWCLLGFKRSEPGIASGLPECMKDEPLTRFQAWDDGNK